MLEDNNGGADPNDTRSVDQRNNDDTNSGSGQDEVNQSTKEVSEGANEAEEEISTEITKGDGPWSNQNGTWPRTGRKQGCQNITTSHIEDQEQQRCYWIHFSAPAHQIIKCAL